MCGKAVWFFILLCNTCVLAQNKTIDSLQWALQREGNQQTKSDILHELAAQTWDYDFERGLAYAQEALKFAKAEKYLQGQAQALTDIGLYYYFKGDYTQALVNYKESNRVIQGTLYSRYPAYTLVRIANLFRVQAQFDSALFYYHLTEKTLDRKENIFSRSSLYQNLGILNNDLSNFAEAIDYFKKAIKIRTDLRDTSLVAESWNGMGQSYKGLSKFDSAIFFFDKAHVIAKRHNNPEFEMYYFLNRGEIHFLQGEYSSAINLYSKALEILKEHDFQRYYIIALKNIGQVLFAKSEYTGALEHYQRAMRIAQKMNSRQEVAQLNADIGWLYAAQQNDSLSFRYANLSLSKMEEIKDIAGIAFANNLIGYIYFTKEEYEKSIAYYEKALDLREKINSQVLIASTLFNIARVLEEQGLLQKALEYQLKAAESNVRNVDREGIVFSYNSLGSLYTKLGDYRKAETYLLSAQKLATEITQPLRKLENFKYLINLYKGKSDFVKALEYSEYYIALDDSIFNIQATGKMAEMNSLYELQNKEQEIQLLNQQNEIKQNQILLQQGKIKYQSFFLIFTVVGILFLLIIAYVLWRYYKAKSKINLQLVNLNKEIQEQKEEIQAQSEELQETNESLKMLNSNLVEKGEQIQAQSEELTQANEFISSSNRNLELKVDERTTALKQAYKELDTFFYRSSHDFRRPLTTLMGLAEVAKITLKDRSALELFGKVNETAIGVDRMLIKLQSVSLIASSELVYGEIDFDRKIDHVCELLHSSIIDKRVKIVRQVKLERLFYSYPAIIEIIIQNIIENAIYYTRQDPEIIIRIEDQQRTLKIEIGDNGEGIAPEFQNRIFEMYFRANEKSKGNGLGLYIVKKAVDKLGGVISFTSRRGEGTVFTVNLPFDQKSLEFV